ncbi:HAD-IIB family hydrolase [Mycoplasmopsis columbinasalis]|uniref:COF family HAD hydrolase protein n=1 Tax=Mycoplasmopsis columbinasalis TaxID=114880 RepID=A0A449BB72_9BACT|nr:HAD-IIB family hydrolase [Mycoplasmopsis columbinasalis]VEU78288.1 COF family HAD hydrolase protein [Mycoplasmopsis columbinasalis]
MNKLIQKPKIIFIDLDGTTLDKRENGEVSISQENIDAVKECTKQGIEVVVSTGRGDVHFTWELSKKMGLTKNIIFWNGSKVVKNNETIFARAIAPTTIQKMFDLAAKNGITTIINSNYKQKSYSTCLFYKAGILFRGASAKKYKDFKNDEDVFKLIFWHIRGAKLKKFYEALLANFSNEVTVSYAGVKNNYLEVTAIGCSKGEAEEFYAKASNIEIKDCMHIGDSMNDHTTCGVVGNVVALANSVPKYKEDADTISPYPCNTGGLAKTLKSLVLD